MLKTASPKFPGSFGKYVCEHDTILATHNGITYSATILRDDDNTPPDLRQDGYWPSLDPKTAGYIGPKSKRALAREHKRMQDVLDAWNRDEWFYCGVLIRASFDSIEIERNAASLWGIEANYPRDNRNRIPNKYLTEVANELLPEAIAAAESRLADIVTKFASRT